jgi:hypothetical protein
MAPEPAGHGGEEDDGAEHVYEEHEGEENAHVGLEFEVGEEPETDADREGEAGEDDGGAGVFVGDGHSLTLFATMILRHCALRHRLGFSQIQRGSKQPETWCSAFGFERRGLRIRLRSPEHSAL